MGGGNNFFFIYKKPRPKKKKIRKVMCVLLFYYNSGGPQGPLNPPCNGHAMPHPSSHMLGSLKASLSVL